MTSLSRGPVSDYEKLRTLRVMIVHAGEEKTGVVEHNRMVLVEPSSGAILNDDLRFKVSSGERKHIYLFANEAAVSYDFSSIAEGELFLKTGSRVHKTLKEIQRFPGRQQRQLGGEKALYR